HLDARAVLAGQVLDQLAEVHTLLGQEVKDDPLAAEQVLDIDQLHLELAGGDEAVAGLELAQLGLSEAGRLGLVLLALAAHRLAAVGLGVEAPGPRGRFAQDSAGSQAALGGDDDEAAAGVAGTLGGGELAEEAHGAVSCDVLTRHGIPTKWQS